MADLTSSESEPEPDLEPEASDEEYQPRGVQRSHVDLTPQGGWSSTTNAAFDVMMNNRMSAVWEQEDVVHMHPSARNTGEAYSKIRPQPLAPRNGFYDERYVCETLPQDNMDEDADFEFLIGSDEDGIAPPRRVTFAFKGVQDYTVEMLARFLDETSPRWGSTIKSWREQGEGVRQLYLNDNPITDAGIAFLADALKNNSTIEELYLHYTHCNDLGLQHLLEMLGHNNTLRKLELGACGITEKGAKAVLKAFERGGVASRNSTLEHLGLFSNADSIDDDLPAIADLLEPASRAKRK